jgi:hypothetical protein
VVAGDGDVGDSNLALVAATDADAVGGHVLDDHHVVGLFGHALEHEVRADGAVDGEEFELDSVLFDEARVLLLADLAVELLEVVLDGAAHHFLAHLRLVPLLQAPEVHQRASPRTLARRAQELPRLHALPQHAVLALQALPLHRHRPHHDALVVQPKLGLHLPSVRA